MQNEIERNQIKQKLNQSKSNPSKPKKTNTVNSCYFEFQGAFWNTTRYPYFKISDLQNWGETNSINNI